MPSLLEPEIGIRQILIQFGAEGLFLIASLRPALSLAGASLIPRASFPHRRIGPWNFAPSLSQMRARPSSITHKALFHDVRRRASSRPCQMAKAPTARIVIVIAMILSLLIDASCSGRGSFIVVSSLSWVSRESGSRHSNHEVVGCPSSANEEDFLHLTSVTRQIYPVSNLACCASTITQ